MTEGVHGADNPSVAPGNRTRPRLAVLIPVFNDHGGLERSLASLAKDAARFDVFVVDDREIVDAMRTLMQRIKILPEPAGAAALAALLCGRVPIPPGATVAVVVSGGNVDLARLKELL